MKKLVVRIENIKSLQRPGLHMGCLLFVAGEEISRSLFFLGNVSLMGKQKVVSSGLEEKRLMINCA